MKSTQPSEGVPGAPPLPPGRFVELPGRGTTFVRESGTRNGGPSVVLLHGLAATASLNWYCAFPALERDYHVIALDHRGHGRGIRDGHAFTLRDAADDVVALADALDIERCIAVGYSMGGPIAQLMWRRHRERVSGLVLCATSYTFRAHLHERAMFAALPALEQVTRIVPDVVSAEVIARLAARYLATCDYGEWAQSELRLRDQRAVLQAASALGTHSAHRWIRDVDVPTSVLVHARDQLVSPARQHALAARIPGATTHIVDADHFAPVRRPSVFTSALVRALDDVAKPPAPAQLRWAS